MSFFTTFSFPYMLNSSLGGQGCFWIYSVVSFAGKDIHILIPDDKELRLAQVNQSVSNISFCHQHICPQLKVILWAKCLKPFAIYFQLWDTMNYHKPEMFDHHSSGFIFIASAVPETSGKTEAQISMLFQKVSNYFLNFPSILWSISESRMQGPQGKPSNTNPKKRP